MHGIHLSSPRRFTVCVLLLCFAAAFNARAEKWEAYKYPADGFRASFPSEPKVERNLKEAATGSLQMNSYCVHISNADLCVAVIDQGPQPTGLKPEEMLGRTKLGVLAAPKTREIHEEQIDLNGRKGIEMETENDAVHVLTRIYLIDQTIYQTMVAFPIGSPFAGAKRFLDSFRLIERVRP